MEILDASVLGGTGLPSFHSGIISYFLSATLCVMVVALQSTLCNQRHSGFDLVTQKYEQNASVSLQSRPWWCVWTQMLGKQSVTKQHQLSPSTYQAFHQGFSPPFLVSETLHFHLKRTATAQKHTHYLLCLWKSSLSDLPTESSATYHSKAEFLVSMLKLSLGKIPPLL